MNRPTMLLSWILRNAGLLASVAVERDVLEIERRYEHEGLSFLTITLPVLCDALDQGLAKSRIAVSDFPGFKPASRNGSLPGLLQGFFIRVFNKDGSLKTSPCIDSIFAIRQVTRAFKKLEYPCTNTRNVRAFERYVQNDESLNGTCSFPGDRDVLRVVSGYLWSDLESLAERLYCSAGVFGSGACAERAGFNARHDVTHWPERAECSFPMAFHTSHDEGDRETFSGITVIPESREHPVRVVGVPKTLKTPRIISIEPSYMMLMQQSVMAPLVEWLETGRLGFKSIRFSDQTENRRLARLGSISGNLATIDLSDASDRVSNDLVCRIFGGVAPSFLKYIQDCRSRTAKLPDGQVIFLRKFASMGSALCFPIEAMVFLTIAVAACLATSGQRPSRRSIRSITAKIAVYGDDIIVPTPMAAGVMEWLEAFELKVNHTKSFTQGYFRESCGGDYYKGVDVTPAYVRRFDFSGKRLSGSKLAAYVSLSNQLYMKGMWHASQQIRNHVERNLRRTFSRTRQGGAGLTWQSVIFDAKLKWDHNLQCWAALGVRLKSSTRKDRVQTMSGSMLRVFSPKESGRQTSHTSLGTSHRLSSSTEYVDGLGSSPQVWGRNGVVALEGIPQRPLQLGCCRVLSHSLPSNDGDCATYKRESHGDRSSSGRTPPRGSVPYVVQWEGSVLNTWHLSGSHGKVDGISTPQSLTSSVRPQALNTKLGWFPMSNIGNWQ